MNGGHVDPAVHAVNDRQRALLTAIRRRLGYSLTYHGNGGALVLRGPNVHVIAADLRSLTLDDLTPKER